MKFYRHDHEINMPNGVEGMMFVVGPGHGFDEMFHEVGPVLVEGRDLNDGRIKLFDEQPNFLAAGGGGNEFPAGDGVFFARKRKNFPADKRKVGGGSNGEMAEDHASDEDAKDQAMRQGHALHPLRHGRPVPEAE